MCQIQHKTWPERADSTKKPLLSRLVRLIPARRRAAPILARLGQTNGAATSAASKSEKKSFVCTSNTHVRLIPARRRAAQILHAWGRQTGPLPPQLRKVPKKKALCALQTHNRTHTHAHTHAVTKGNQASFSAGKALSFSAGNAFCKVADLGLPACFFNILP